MNADRVQLVPILDDSTLSKWVKIVNTAA